MVAPSAGHDWCSLGLVSRRMRPNLQRKDVKCTCSRNLLMLSWARAGNNDPRGRGKVQALRGEYCVATTELKSFMRLPQHRAFSRSESVAFSCKGMGSISVEQILKSRAYPAVTRTEHQRLRSRILQQGVTQQFDGLPSLNGRVTLKDLVGFAV